MLIVLFVTGVLYYALTELPKAIKSVKKDVKQFKDLN